ncbi:MAG: Sir2 family NAD-dependent protein deacetylase, partial [Pseudomonas sp.]|uniref:Sir2 family NAD-dependent protein deacetylase n=1 Tax=Pseudomonas sp. TaxID=306 RepID=UPI003919FAF9
MLDTLEHQQDHLDTLHRAMADRRFLVLTGAGISTSSGIPDYRDSEGVRRGKAPMMYQEFLATVQARRRYWARAMLGWPRVRIAQPNNAHRALATLQQRQRISGLITQNVDTLHDQAGSHDVIELHGSLHWVLCLDCQQRSERDVIQRLMETRNPFLAGVDAVQAPDGDTLLDPAFGDLPADLGGEKNRAVRERIAEHFVQRRRGDIRHFLQTDTPFPDREEKEETYKLHQTLLRWFPWRLL